MNSDALIKWLEAKIKHYGLIGSSPAWRYKAIAYREVLKKVKEIANVVNTK